MQDTYEDPLPSHNGGNDSGEISGMREVHTFMNKIFNMAFLHEMYPMRGEIFITPPTTVTKQNMEREKLDYIKVREKQRIPG